MVKARICRSICIVFLSPSLPSSSGRRTSREVDYIATRRRSVYKDVCVPLFSDLNDGYGSLAKLILYFFLMSTRLCYFNKMLFLFTQYNVSTRTGQGIKTFFIKSVKGWMGHIFNNRNPLLLLSLCWWLQKFGESPRRKKKYLHRMQMPELIFKHFAVIKKDDWF